MKLVWLDALRAEEGSALCDEGVSAQSRPQRTRRRRITRSSEALSLVDLVARTGRSPAQVYPFTQSCQGTCPLPSILQSALDVTRSGAARDVVQRQHLSKPEARVESRVKARVDRLQICERGF